MTSLPVFVVSCEGENDKSAPVLTVLSKTSFTLSDPESNPGAVSLSSEAGSAFVKVSTTDTWSISATFAEGSESWMTVTPSSGTGSKSDVVLSWAANPDTESRSAALTISSDGGASFLDFTQAGKAASGGNKGDEGGKTSAVPLWIELPETSADDGYDFFSHDMTIGSVNARNWSFYWDYENRVSRWVAYPLCSWNIGSSVSRTDAWGYDPLLPAGKQQNVSGGYREGNNGWYSRGHQIPSADRLTSYAANSTTFYGTNMTPQDNNFNGGVWLSLENSVRSWARRCDTLYVVTGCVTDGAKYYALDRSGNRVTVPTGYFKAVLRYAKNSTVGYSGYLGCAFYYDHEADRNSTFSKSQSMSISDLEKKLGYSLFVNLDAAVGKSAADQIKSENPANVSWWW